MKRLPRKFKAKIKRIPAGPYCYGEFLGSHPKTVNGIREWKGGFCPYWHRAKGEAGEDATYCSFVKQSDVLLADHIKICGDYDILFDYKTGKININSSNAKCLLIDELPKEQQEPYKMWLNGNVASVPTIGTFGTNEHYDFWVKNVLQVIIRLQKKRENREV